MKIGELFVQLGVKADTPIVKEFARSINDIPLQIAGAITAIAGIEYSMVRLAQQALETATGFRTFESMTGESAESLNRWQNVAKQVSVSADAVSSSISNLKANAAKIQMGLPINAMPYYRLGISPLSKPFDILEQLRKTTKAFPRAQASEFLRQMGVAPEMMRLFAMNDEEFRRRINKVAPMSEEEIRTLAEAQSKLKTIGLEFAKMMADVTMNISEATDKSAGFREVLIGLAAAVGVLALIIAPVTTILAAASIGVTAFINDLSKFFTGKDSVIGDTVNGLLSKTKMAGPNVEELIGRLDPSLYTPGAGAIKTIEQVFNVNFSGNVTGLPDFMSQAEMTLRSAVSKAYAGLNNTERK